MQLPTVKIVLGDGEVTWKRGVDKGFVGLGVEEGMGRKGGYERSHGP